MAPFFKTKTDPNHSQEIEWLSFSYKKHLRKFKSSRSRSSLTYPLNEGGAGRKGGQKQRERKYQQEEIHTSNQLFSEIWHNNEPFEITFVIDIQIERNFCNYCRNEFPRGPFLIVPYDIAIKPKERWKYLNRNRKSESEPLYLPSSAKKLTTRFYRIRRRCIFNRFPYFKAELLKHEHIALTKIHKKILKEQVDVSIWFEKGNKNSFILQDIACNNPERSSVMTTYASVSFL